MHTVLDFGSRFGMVWVGQGGCVAGCIAVGVVAELLGRNGEEAIFNGFDGAVNDGVYGVDDVVDEGLWNGCKPIERCLMRYAGLPEECSGDAL